MKTGRKPEYPEKTSTSFKTHGILCATLSSIPGGVGPVPGVVGSTRTVLL